MLTASGFMETGSTRFLGLRPMANSMSVSPLVVTCVLLTVAAWRINWAGVVCQSGLLQVLKAVFIWPWCVRSSPAFQRPLPHGTPRDDGQKNQVGGHIDRSARKRGRGHRGRRQRRSRKGPPPSRRPGGLPKGLEQAAHVGSHQGALLIVQRWPHLFVAELLLHLSHGLALPTHLVLVGFCVFLQNRWELGQLCPRWHLQPASTSDMDWRQVPSLSS